METLESLISQHPFFTGMNSKQMKILAACALRKEYAPNQYVFREDGMANRFYLLQEGKVALESLGENQNVITIQTIGAGGVLGWSWLFPPYRWHFDARALEPTRAILFYATRLRTLCEKNQKLGYELLKRMSATMHERLQATRRHLLES
jgi:CRP-like cAMP-binding protein